MSIRKCLNTVFVLIVFTLMFSLSAVCVYAADPDYSDASVDSTNATTINADKSVTKCTLTPQNNFMTAYKLTPAENGYYIFFSGGEKKQIKGSLYEGVGDTDTMYRMYYDESDSGVFCFMRELEAGVTYTLLVQGYVEDTNSVFDVCVLKKEAGKFLTSTSAITLTDANNSYMLAVGGGDPIPGDCDWVYSDDSVLGSRSSYGISSGDPEDEDYYNVGAVELYAKKSGTSTASLIDRNTNKAYTTNCKVTGVNITEYYDLWVGGVQVTSKNASNITGKGISGKVSYDAASNTLTLNSATLSSACKSEGLTDTVKTASNKKSDKDGSIKRGDFGADWGDYTGVINHHTLNTLKIKLVGTNKISGVTMIAQDDGNNYDASSSYSGINGVSSCGPVELLGTGSLSINSSNIGTALYCSESVTVAEGTSLSINVTNNNDANGIVAGKAVTVNGTLKDDVKTRTFVVDGEKACVTGYGIKAAQFIVGSKGTATLNASTDCDATSYCVMLYSGGSAKISGKLNAKAVGASGERAGVAIGSKDDSTGLQVLGSGTATLQGNKAALDSVSFVRPILVKAGSDASSVKTILPEAYNGQAYVFAKVPGACTGGHALTKVNATKSTETTNGNIEYWICDACGKIYADAAGKTEITAADTVLPMLASSLYLTSPSNGATFDVGAEIRIGAYSDIFMFTYVAGMLIPNQPNYIYVRVIKNGAIVGEMIRLSYYEPGEDVHASFTATTAGRYTIQVSKRSDFSSIRSVEIQVGKEESTDPTNPSNPTNPTNPSNPAEQMGSDGTALGKGASAEAAEAAILAMKNDKDPAGSKFGQLQTKSTKQTKTSVTVTWKKVKGAKKYIVYGNKCGKSNHMQKQGATGKNTVKITKIKGNNGKKAKVKKGTYYKFLVVALDKNNKVISSSKMIHVVTKGGKTGNDKKVTTKAKKNKVTLKKGKSFKLAAKTVPVSKKLKVKKHRGICYESSKTKIATVSKKGVIKAKKKGTCYVYAYAQNGVAVKIKVTVK